MTGKKLAIGFLAAFTAAALPGCAGIEPASPEDGYATSYAMSAVEYTIYLDKQITAVENLLLTRYSCANEVSAGAYSASTELDNTAEDIDKVQTIIDEVTTTMPASGYETDRQNTLDLLEDAKAALEAYQGELSSGSAGSSAEDLKACYLALSGESNIYYQ